MEKYVRVNEINKDHPTIYTGEEIADIVRGSGKWNYNYNGMPICDRCGAANKNGKNFCTYCGAKQVEV